MRIKSIELTNFRNYKTLNLNLGDHINLVYGKNAQGKTNFLESIYFAAFSKSFRTQKDKELLLYGEPFLKVKLYFETSSREQTIEIVCTQENKKIRVNGSPATKPSELVGKVNIATFFPEDLALIKGSPDFRRRFLNKEISQLYPAHVTELMDYTKLLYQRNTAIKNYNAQSKDMGLISLWDEQLADLGAKIVLRRKKFIDELNKYANAINTDLSSKDENFIIKYSGPIPSQKAENYDKIKGMLLEDLRENLMTDIRYGHTMRGPQKDDFDVYIDGRQVKIYASQGQKRTSALAIKLAGIELITKLIKERPVVILDDVFSELDQYRRSALMSYLAGCQSFISLTELESFNIAQDRIAKFQVIEGSVEQF